MSLEKMTNDELIELIGNSVQKEIITEYEKIKEQTAIFDITVPESLDNKIRYLGVPVKRKKLDNLKISTKIAVSMFIVVAICSTYFFVNPKAVTAIKKIYRQLKFETTEQSVVISLMENHWPQIPTGFNLTEYTNEDINCISKFYKNENGNYIKVSLFTPDIEIVLDNENAGIFEPIIINKYEGLKILKGGISTVYLFGNDWQIIIVSDLSMEEIEDIAATIQ